MKSIHNYTISELKKIAKDKKISKYSSLNKHELYNKLSDTKSKVAFCFLLYDSIQHLNIWETFFNEDPNKNSHNIYSHLKTVTDNTPKWVKQAKVRTVRTDWCGEGLINAFAQMLKKALKNNDNKYFVLLSGSCIPLYTYKETIQKILSSKRSRISYQNISGNVFEGEKGIYNAHQWVILNRDVAEQYSRLYDAKDTEAKQFIKDFRKLYRKHGADVGNKGAIKYEGSTWLGGCPDEIYPINWLHHVYGKDLSKNVKKQMSTYTYWDFQKDPDHPYVFDMKSIKKMKNEICNTGHIFARKFTKEAANFIAMNCGNKNTIVYKELVGRIGNQMFQYASSLGIAYKKYGKACIITDKDLISYDELRKEKEDLINVCKGPFKICNSININSDLLTVVPETGYAKYNIKPFMIPGNIEIETDLDQGFLQSYKYFKDIEPIIRKKFKFKKSIENKTNKFLISIKDNNKKFIGVHVRRGDQLGLEILNFPPVSYFDKSRNYFKDIFNGNVKFVVVTNDRNWCKYNLEDKDTHIVTHTKNAIEDLSILSECDGVIMSIGTFSWWGAWLSNGPVIYYKNEFNMKNSVNKNVVKKSDYYLKSWIPMK
jgi:galactoside 2-L-fucosyltransferase 1/2